ncbi:sensor histidine kinase [Candidatus Nitrosocosmicus sp. T]
MEYNSRRTIILPIVLASSIILAILSYNYFTQTANQIQELAIDDLQTNAEIEAYSISNSLSNAISAVTSNLRLIANSPSTMEGNISKIQTLFDLGLESTSNLTDGYYFLDNNGRLKTFTGIEKEQNAKYRDIDLSHREYFQIPKQNEIPYISTVIDSNDNVPRMYISFPILEINQTRLSESVESQSNLNLTDFKGVMVASIAAKTLGNFLEGQTHPKFSGDIAFMDRDGTIIYTQNQTYIGKNFFGGEFQSYLKSILKDKTAEFNNIINKALDSESGLNEFNFENTSTTIAYEAVRGLKINENGEFDNSIGTLFITIPHTLAGDVASIIDNQKIINFSTIALIAAIASAITVVLLKWNKTLQEVVKQKTSLLQETVDKLKSANEDLHLHDKMQKEFINVAAHELRTPSQAISGNLELIEMAYLPSLFETQSEAEEAEEEDTANEEFENLVRDKNKLQQFKSVLVSTYRNSQRLDKLVNDILDISRIESNRLELHKEYFNLNEKIKNVIKDIHSRQSFNPLLKNLQKNNINIDFEACEDPITVFADKIRIFEVITNLLTNAIKFSEDKPITISVKKIQKNTIDLKHQLSRNNEQVDRGDTKENKNETMNMTMMMAVVSIRDRGRGIDPDILPRLFTKFTTKSNQGTGLGLYIAKSIIEAHGGQIWAQNNYNGEKGATFLFSLPLNR